MTGGESIEEVAEIMKQTTELLKEGHFQIRKWCSNASELLNGISSQDKEKLLRFHDGTDFTKTLGLLWDPASDRFLFSVSPGSTSPRPTKRSILSIVARFYDPLGLVGPIITKAKIFLQLLWKEQLHWDESLPASLASAWIAFYDSLSNSPRFTFPRLVVLPDTQVEVHGFCDASILAYGACIYIVSRGKGITQSQLLCSRSRVAPLKGMTVPKLELCGAELLAQLINEVAGMKIFAGRFYCWSDSTTVLSWIRSEPARFTVFVSNRVASIQKLTLTYADWRYIPTKLNPADTLSRGALPSELIGSKLWFEGPAFLSKDQASWPVSVISKEPLPELRKRVFLATCPFADLTEGHKFANSFHKLQRSFGYMFKFHQRTKSSGLTLADLVGGTRMLVRSIQQVHLWSDLICISEKGQVALSSSTSSLNPFVDEFGILRVGGRLKNSTLDFNARHPIILPRSHPVTVAMILYFHERNLHAGPRALLAIIRHQYWPVGGRKLVASVVNKCIRCFRAKPRLLQHIMADLPKERLDDGSYTFMITGEDFCGPFYYKSEVRTRPPIKCYICVFICFATKAIHLELVQDLSSPAFISALQRFISTRCRPREIWSDNATNFVGASNELKRLKELFMSDTHQKAVQDFCVADQIDWRFIPPRSPHFGGLWEAASIQTTWMY
nr:uncharacterized protein LOC123002408 [Drosophila takahashii]